MPERPYSWRNWGLFTRHELGILRTVPWGDKRLASVWIPSHTDSPLGGINFSTMPLMGVL